MSDELKYLLFLATLFALLFASAELLRRIFYVKGEYTRKYVHILTGIFTLLFPVLLGSFWSVLLLCSLFAVILLLSKKWNQLRSIHGVKRNTHGSFWYPVAVCLAFFVFQYTGSRLFFYLPILIMAFADPLAALVGQRFPIKKYSLFKSAKSFGGSLAFFFTAFIISVALILYITRTPLASLIVVSFITGIVTAFTEALSTKGSDNISIPVAAILALILFDKLGLIIL